MPVELLPQRRLSDELRTGTSPDLTRRRWAIARTVLLITFATITLTVFFLLLFAVGALG